MRGSGADTTEVYFGLNQEPGHLLRDHHPPQTNLCTYATLLVVEYNQGTSVIWSQPLSQWREQVLRHPKLPPPSLAAGLRKRPAVSPSPAQPPRAIRKEFWTSSVQEGPIYKCSPWKFYEPFLKRGTEDTLVLCNDRTKIRVLRSYSKMADHITTFRQIRHVNSVHIYELHSFEDKTYGVLEYMDLSLTVHCLASRSSS
jgi:hypothetical protein